jgi:hypothetical protein
MIVSYCSDVREKAISKSWSTIGRSTPRDVIKAERKEGLSIVPDLPEGTDGEGRERCCWRGRDQEDNESDI